MSSLHQFNTKGSSRNSCTAGDVISLYCINCHPHAYFHQNLVPDYSSHMANGLYGEMVKAHHCCCCSNISKPSLGAACLLSGKKSAPNSYTRDTKLLWHQEKGIFYGRSSCADFIKRLKLEVPIFFWCQFFSNQ